MKANYLVFVSKGSFKTVCDAAYSEEKANLDNEDILKTITECFGATDMVNVLKNVKGLNIRICEEEYTPQKNDTLIFVGSNACEIASLKYDIPLKEISEKEEFVISVKTVNETKVVLIYSKEREGTLYGLSSYMEYHGIRFISPGESGTFYEKCLDLSQSGEYDITERPDFKTREGFSSFINDDRYDFLLWLMHNKFNTISLKQYHKTALMKKLCLKMAIGRHDMWYEYMDVNQEYPYCHKLFGGEGKPEDPYEVSPYYKGDINNDGILTYGEAHPEWYAQTDGERKLFRDYKAYKERGYATGDFICTSNDDAVKEFIRLYVNELAEGKLKHLEQVKLYALDNGTWCSCEKCSEDETYSYKLLMVAYKLDKAIKKATEEGRIKRKILISIPAYHETLIPPHKELPKDFDYSTISVIFYVIERCYLHNINDLKCTETNKLLYDRLMAWVNGYYKGEITIGEYYNVSSFSAMPFVLCKCIINDIPFYYSVGARHMHYMHMTASHWGVSAINNYLFAKLMWNKDYDGENLKNEYFKAKYSENAEKMKVLYAELEEACSNCKFIKHYQYIHDVRRSLFAELKAKKENIFDFNHIKFDNRADDYQAGPSLSETVERYEKAFDVFSKDDSLKEYKEDYEQLLYGLYMLKYMYYNTAYILGEGSDEMKEKIDYYAEKLKNETISLGGYDNGNMFVNGLTATFMLEN